MWSWFRSHAVGVALLVVLVSAGAASTGAADPGLSAAAVDRCGVDCPVAVQTTAAGVPNGSGSLSVAHVTQGTVGETVRMAVRLGNASVATVTVGGPEFNYEVTGMVRDGNGDGRVDVRFDTTAAGRDAPTLGVANASDEVTPVGKETALDGALDPADYDVTVTRGTDADAPPADVGTLVVHDSAWEPTATEPEPERPRAVGPTSDGVVASIPLDAAGTIAIGLGLALLSLRILFVSRR